MSPIEHLRTEFFSKTKAIQFRPDLEGQRIEDGVIHVGDRSGPNHNDVSALAHEMSHFVEIDDDRMTSYGWGLRLPEVYAINRICIEPLTCQATKRELRVIAFQLNLCEYIGLSLEDDYTVSSLRFMPDTTFVPLEDGSQPYGEITTHGLDYNEIQASQQRWRLNQVKALRAIHTLDVFLSEWGRKVEVLERRLRRRRKPSPWAKAETIVIPNFRRPNLRP